MRDKYFYEVMFDDTSIDVSKEVGLVWSIANSLRGAYTSDKYKDVIIPMVIIRRFECALEATKDAVVAKHKQNPNLPAALLCQISKYPFYNTNEFTLKRLLDDSDSIASNLKSYIEGFSANIQLILEKLLKFSTQIDKMDKSNRLYSVVKKFSDLDLYPAHVDSMKMGYIFEDIIRRFSENAEAGDHYTPREVIRLMVNVLLAEGCNDLLTDEGKIATVLDKTTPRLIQFHTLKNAANPPFLGGFSIFGTVAAGAEQRSCQGDSLFSMILCNDRKAIVTE